MKKTLVFILAVAMVLTLLPATALAENATLTVGTGGTYTSIQAAVDEASKTAGTTTINIKAGTYNETVKILQQPDVNIVLQGERGTVFTGNMIIDGNGRYNGPETLQINNITFDKSGQTLTSSVDIIALKGLSATHSYTHNVTIQGCSFIGDKSGINTVAVRVGEAGGNTAYNTTIKNCTFTQLHSIVQARCQGLIMDTVTGTNVISGINAANSSNITLKNVKIYAVKYGFRLGESSGTAENGDIKISNCVLSASAPSASDEATIMIRASSKADILITSSDIFGNVVNLSSNSLTLTLDDVYLSGDISGFKPSQAITQTNALTVPHPSQTATEVKASVNPSYIIVIPASVNFGSLILGSGEITKEFDVTAQGLVIENGMKVKVSVTSDFEMEDAAASSKLAYKLYNSASGGNPFAANESTEFASFTESDTHDGRVTVNTNIIKTAGSYQDTMTFSISYVPVS